MVKIWRRIYKQQILSTTTGHNGPRAYTNNIKLNNLIFTEVYRSGHNGPDSKSGIRQRIVGSNPTASAKIRSHLLGGLLFCTVGSNSSALASTEGSLAADGNPLINKMLTLPLPRGITPLGVSVVSHRFRNDDIQSCVLMIYRYKLRIPYKAYALICL